MSAETTGGGYAGASVPDEERQLRMLRQTAAAVRVGGWEIDGATRRLHWSDEMFRLHERDPTAGTPSVDECLLGFDPEDRPAMVAAVAALLDRGAPFEHEVRLVGARGTSRIVRTVGRAEMDGGRVVRAYGTLQDVTQQSRSRRALEASEVRFRTVVDTAGEGIWEIDADKRTRMVNRRMAAMLGRTPDEMLGTLATDHAMPEHRAQGEARLAERWAGRRTTYEMPMRHKDGHTVWMSFTGTPLLDEFGNVAGSVAVVVDVTERRKAEDALRRARDEAQALARARTQLVGIVSHELRTPLNAIIGASELLGAGVVDDDRDRLLTLVRSSSDTLLALVDDILELSRLDAGDVAIERIGFDLRSLLAGVVEVAEAKLADKSVALGLEIDDALPTLVDGDPTRVRQVLTNIVGNATKFTSEGRIDIRCAWIDEGGDTEGRVRFTVADTGVGLDPTQVARLFEPFTQADASTTRRFGGTGLGLTICRRLVERMAGEIRADGEPGVGARFTVTLPLPEARSSAEPRAVVTGQAAAAPAVRVLVAEDNEVNRVVLDRMLDRLAVDRVLVTDGEAAVAQVARGGFDLVLMDLSMPRMDGIEATRAIRALPGAQRLVPIVALTANAFEKDRERCLAAGMNAFLTKPIRLAVLQDILGRVEELRPSSPAPPPGPASVSAVGPAREG